MFCRGRYRTQHHQDPKAPRSTPFKDCRFFHEDVGPFSNCLPSRTDTIIDPTPDERTCAGTFETSVMRALVNPQAPNPINVHIILSPTAESTKQTNPAALNPQALNYSPNEAPNPKPKAVNSECETPTPNL